MKFKIYFLILVFVACGKKEDEFKSSFANVDIVNLNSQEVRLKTDISFSSMFKMEYCDSLLIVSEIRDPEFDLKIVDLERGTVRNFAKRGKGPGEIKNRAVNFSVDKENKNLYLVDGKDVLIYSFDSLKRNVENPFKSFTMKLEEFRMRENTYFQDNIIGVFGIDHQNFGIYNQEDGSFIKKSTPDNEDLPKGVLNNQIFLVSHPRRSKVAYFYYSSAIFGIINIDGKKLEINENFYWATPSKETRSGPKTSVDHTDEERNSFITATADANFIYALYSGKSMNVNSMEELTDTFLSSIVYVFDWDGTPVKKIKLDQEVRSISVDSENNILYAASYKDDIPNLIKFDLK